MKFRVTLKDPDSLHDAVIDAVRENLINLNLEEDEKEVIEQLRCEKEYSKASKWFEWGEYVTLEIDTEADNCIVVKVN